MCAPRLPFSALVYHPRMFGQDDSPRPPLYERMSVELLGAEPAPPPEGEPGAGLTLRTTRGDVACILHEPDEGTGVGAVWAAGARGGFSGPANGLYRDLAVELAERGIAGLRVNYRHPAHLDESVLDVLVAVWHMASIGYPRVALVGHSFGGASCCRPRGTRRTRGPSPRCRRRRWGRRTRCC